MRMRAASPRDARQAARLLLAASGELAYLSTGATTEAQALTTFEAFFLQQDNLLSYHYTVVSERDQQVVGLILAYPGSEEPRLAKPLEAHVQRVTGQPLLTLSREAEADEWYVHSLAVDPAYGGQGIGTALLHQMETVAGQHGYQKISLNVASQNEKARRLYQRLGYRPQGTFLLQQVPMLHMVKALAVPGLSQNQARVPV